MDDRIKSEDAELKLPKPEVSIVRNGETVYKPGMKTWFVDTADEEAKEIGAVFGEVNGSRQVVTGGTVCTCNTVCTLDGVEILPAPCALDGVTIPSVPSVPSVPSSCSCNTVNTCPSHGSYCSCNQVCSCVPVH